jgi:glycosyltransferase involved in cell wall biosynthesis
VTDVGDAAEVVGDTGCVVPPGDPRALSLGWKRTLDRPSNEDEALRLRLRDRIDANYAIERLVARTEAVLAEVVRTGDPHRIRRENR